MRRRCSRFFQLTVAMATLVSGALDAQTAAPTPDRGEVGGLAALFEPGAVLQDRNADGLTDFVAARIVLPNTPAPEEVAAAAAIAARLGFETSGLSLPLVVASEDVTPSNEETLIVVGGGNPLLPAEVRERVERLGPGQGIVAITGERFAVAGKDPQGTRAAAEAFASRSPYLWQVIGRENGDTFDRVADELTELLTEGSIPVSDVSVDEILFEKDRPEAVSVVVSVVLANGVARARAALTDLDARHNQGRDTDRLSYSSARSVTYRLSDASASEEVTLARVGTPQWLLTPPRGSAFGDSEGSGRPAPAGEFDLSDLFTSKGLLKDTDEDRIPDETDTGLVLPSSGEDSSSSLPGRGVAHLAARLGLESTGVRFPLVTLDSEEKEPERRRNLVLFGEANRLAHDLKRLGKRRSPEAGPGVGFVEVVPDAFAKSPAVVVSGGDEAGAEAAAEYLARRAPYVWSTERGQPKIEDVKEAVRRLVNGRTAPGQAALAFAQIEKIVEELGEKELDSFEVRAYLENASPAFDRFVEEYLRDRLQVGTLTVTSRARSDPEVVFEEKPSIEWEVDDFRNRFRAVISKLTPGSPVSVELRVSEAPEQRAELEEEIRAAIAKAGAEPKDVRVLSAYKQGLSWLLDEVAPALQTLSPRPASIVVSWKPVSVDTSQKWRFYSEPARWLNELYPADELLARELGLPLSAISFASRDSGEDIYRVSARDGQGREIFEDGFSPAVYERPFHKAFPEKARVTVTTGWVRVVAAGQTLVDERVPTDLDRIWDYYQDTALAKVYDHVKKATGGKPTQKKQPFFHTLRFELEASEPDYRLGLDQEQVSSLESIHDDVYFDTLAFFYEVVEAAEGKAIGARRGAPGNVLPWIHPERRGQAPNLTVTLTGYASIEPKVVVAYTEKDGEKKEDTYKLEPVDLPSPSAFLAEVHAGDNRLTSLSVGLALKETEPLQRLADLLDNLTRFQTAGFFRDAFGFGGVSQVKIRIDAPGATSTRTFDSAGPQEHATSTPIPGEQLVRWDHVISPDESERIAHALNAFPEITTYVAGRSFQGRPVSVMEIKLPMEAELVSQAKMSTWKPVLSIMARQHANEVSSTSHALRLAELLATDPEYRRYLNRMNVVIQPVVNPDGAALAYELQKLTPYHCLHAGRYSALGPDVPTEARNPDTLITEALVLNKVFETWLPDVQLNPHGYPTHEWVQTFANYNPYDFRSYWIPRGWYTSVRPSEDPRYPAHRAAAFAMRDYIAEEVSRDPEVRSTNLRIYDRYRRWTTRWQPHVYDLEVHKDTAIYFSRRSGTVPTPRGNGDVTVFSAGTEAMDETAQGEWLDLVTRMGFGFLMASVKFLDEADYSLYRREEERRESVTLSLTRPRPVETGRSPRVLAPQ